MSGALDRLRAALGSPIWVLCGGDSPEREVSLRSGRGVFEALRLAGMPCELVEVEGLSDLLGRLRSGDRPSCAFVALHGGWGEDGRLQALLRSLGIPYTGPNPASCHLCMDKPFAKAVFELAGVPTPRWICLSREAGFVPSEDHLGSLGLSLPLVVKPASQGSTVGVSVVEDIGDLPSALELAFSYGDSILLESYVAGLEITVAVVGGPSLALALPPVEISPRGGLYDYAHKYTPGMTEYFSPPRSLDALASEGVKEVALRAYLALGCDGYGRVDLRVDAEGRPFVLEVNAAPGMTQTSLVPKAAAAAGLSFPELSALLVLLALEGEAFLEGLFGGGRGIRTPEGSSP